MESTNPISVSKKRELQEFILSAEGILNAVDFLLEGGIVADQEALQARFSDLADFREEGVNILNSLDFTGNEDLHGELSSLMQRIRDTECHPRNRNRVLDEANTLNAESDVPLQAQPLPSEEEKLAEEEKKGANDPALSEAEQEELLRDLRRMRSEVYVNQKHLFGILRRVKQLNLLKDTFQISLTIGRNQTIVDIRRGRFRKTLMPRETRVNNPRRWRSVRGLVLSGIVDRNVCLRISPLGMTKPAIVLNFQSLSIPSVFNNTGVLEITNYILVLDDLISLL